MIRRRFLIAALTALILSLGAIAFGDIVCPNPNCPNPLDCPGAITGICPYDGQGPGQGQGAGPNGPQDGSGECPYPDCPNPDCPNDGTGTQNQAGPGRNR